MANTVSKSFTVSKAYGSVLEMELKGEFSYEELELTDEIPADEVLTPKDILAAVNTARYAASRAKATAVLFEANGISKPKLLDTEDGRVNSIVKALVAAGNSLENATAMARQVLGLS